MSMPLRAMIDLRRLLAVLLLLCVVCLSTVAAFTADEESENDDLDKIGLLPQTYGIGLPDDEVDWSRHPCRRQCRSDREPLTCRYGLTVERYTSMSKACYECPRNLTDCSRPHCIPGDGTEKIVIVANRKLPGLSIEVCKGDRILVDVTNKLSTETTTIHWHGLHQRGSPYMDGVPYLTQCPIMPGEVFRYDFIADRPGSYIWHSHSGEQRADGLFGPLIVRPFPEENVYHEIYDKDDKVMVINDWTHSTGSDANVIQNQNGRSSLPSSILINGLGRLTSQSEVENVPIEVFQVEEGKRYRFRLLNAGSQDCPIHVSVDDHPMLVISADGADIEPVEVDSIRILTGERYDFVLAADRPVDNYWIRLKGDILCGPLKTPQLAILRYKGAKTAEPEIDPKDPNHSVGKRELNPFDRGTESADAICIAHLNALEPDDISLMREPDHQFFITIDNQKLDNFDYHRKNLYGYRQVNDGKRMPSRQLNRISFKMPNFPPLTQPELIDPEQFCNYSTMAMEKCKTEQCVCTQTFHAKLDSVVELVLIDPGNIKLNHPMHLHGYYYRVVAMRKVGDKLSIEEVKRMDREGKIHRRLGAAPWKDSVIVPSGGYTIVRFHANNPGYWFLHCHFDEHASNGMALVIKVGEHEDFPRVPMNFPRCGAR